jgi:hypothetical protein
MMLLRVLPLPILSAIEIADQFKKPHRPNGRDGAAVSLR